MPEYNFEHEYFRYLLQEETIDVEVKVKTMKGIHTFRRDCTTQIISCKPWSPRLQPYPSLVRRMQTYLELKGQNASQSCPSSNQAVRPTLLWKTPVPKKAIDRRQKKRSRMPIRKQFKVRLVEKPLSHNRKPEATATTATATQTPMMKPTATSIKGPNAKLTPIPLAVYNMPSAKMQEVPRSSMQRPQGGEVPLIPNLNNPPMKQQPKPLQPKAPATASDAIPPTRDDTPWPNTVPASTNLFVGQSWLISLNGNEIPTLALIKMEKRPDAESIPTKAGSDPLPKGPM